MQSLSLPMNARRCAATNEHGLPCQQAPLQEAAHCFWHSPEHAKEAAEARRLGGLRRRREGTVAGAYDLGGLERVGGIRRLLEIAVVDALGLENSLGRVRALTQLVLVATKLLETGEFEARLASMEAAVRPRQLSTRQRLQKLTTSLTPTRAVVLWMAEAHQSPSFIDYAAGLVNQPDATFPLVRLPDQVEEATRRAMKGEPHDQVERALQQALRDVHFLYYLHQYANLRLLDAEELLQVRLLALVEGFQQLLVEELLATELSYLQSLTRRRRTSSELSLPSWAQPAGLTARVSTWRTHALELLGQLYTHRAVVVQLAQRYVAGAALLYPAAASYLAGLIADTERLVSLFNEGLAEALSALPQGDDVAGAPLCLDLAAVAAAQQATVAVAVQGLVLRAQAEALDDVGERRAAHELVTRHLLGSSARGA